MTISRRKFIELAAMLGASAAWGHAVPKPSASHWRERRDIFPEGVASGDPDSNSVLLWTRRAPGTAPASRLTLEVALDSDFHHVVSEQSVPLTADSDWTCRVLVGHLKPATVYWFRFIDPDGNGSRVGRTITAPAENDPRSVRFAFVSCQNANFGAQNAYRRMIFEDEKAPENERLGFVLHLGDFIYELVWYPEDRATYYDRKMRDIVRYPHGEKIATFHIPTTLEDYRLIYKNYLHDPDIQDARARFPFVPMWDNHEFSWFGWQGMQIFNGKTRPAQAVKVAANQAYFEFLPARMAKPSGPSLERFDPPAVVTTPVTTFDEHGLGTEPNNLAAINSLKGYRSLRWGKNVELIITDQRSYRSDDPAGRPEGDPLGDKDYSQFVPQEVMEILDGGRAYNGGKPPDTITYGVTIPNFRRNEPPQTILGEEQKAWFLKELSRSKATWKIWGSTTATLQMRTDPQNLPPEMIKKWPGEGYANTNRNEMAEAIYELGQIYDHVRKEGITGFATVAGDRHSFWAGLAASELPPKRFQPVGVAFVGGSISTPGGLEAYEHNLKKDAPLRDLFLAQAKTDSKPQPTFNMLFRHGVRSCIEYAKTGDVNKARQLSNPELSPHLSFVDTGGHGYAVVHASSNQLETEFVCIPRPIERAQTADGGPILYRVRFLSTLWKKGESPNLKTEIVEGDPRFSI
jgi:alkaline phosphatase D